MKHSHRVHSSKRNLSPKAKSFPVERKEGNTEHGTSNVGEGDTQARGFGGDWGRSEGENICTI